MNAAIEKSSRNSNVSVITNRSIGSSFEKTKIKRVAAYCRVSTELEMQASSLELQMTSYRKIIEEHPGWKLAGIYADKGISGTNVKKRPEFQRMIEDARNNKIDVIMAKSISRFARNTYDTLQYTRELRQIGVTVYFEKEKIDTAAISSELMLTVFAAFAQEESHSISENIKKGRRQRFQMGKPLYARTFGYEKGWVINEEKANIVREIFDMYLNECTTEEIARTLNERGIPSPRDGKGWSYTAVHRILQNEKYVGDAEMQKTYVSDFMTHTVVNNKDAKIDKYYVRDHHEPIVDRDTFEKAQYMVQMRRPKIGIFQYPYYGFLKCPVCGQPMVKIRSSNSFISRAWTCGGRGNHELISQRTNCPTYLLNEEVIDETMKKAILSLESESKDVQITKDKIIDGASISYPMLVDLVENITVEDWDKLVVTWKDGWTGRYNLEFKKSTDVLLPKYYMQDGKYYSFGMRVVGLDRFLDVLNKRQDEALNHRVFQPKPYELQIPIVKRPK